MMKHEFDKIAGVKVDNGVYERIEANYMEADGYNREQWWKKFGKAGIIRCYDEELKDKNNKLSELARAAIESYDRCHSKELLDENDRVTDYDLWGRLMARYGMACDVLGIDEYSDTARNQLWAYVII